MRQANVLADCDPASFTPTAAMGFTPVSPREVGGSTRTVATPTTSAEILLNLGSAMYATVASGDSVRAADIAL